MRENYKQNMSIKILQLTQMVFKKNLKKNTFHASYKEHVNSVWGGLFFSSKLCEFTKSTEYKAGSRGGTVVKVLCYKFEGGWFDSR
jgi:hypothetical protein